MKPKRNAQDAWVGLIQAARKRHDTLKRQTRVEMNAVKSRLRIAERNLDRVMDQNRRIIMLLKKFTQS